MREEKLIRVECVRKTFGPTVAVNDVSFEIEHGEIHGLIGENGSGKSTIASIIAGIQKADSGKVYFNGTEFNPTNQIEANLAGICIIMQEMNTVDSLTVAENIFFGNEDLFISKGFRNIKKMNKMASEYLEEMGLTHIRPSDNIGKYNFEARKMVEMVRASYTRPQLVIVDETTTALSQDGRYELFKFMENIKSGGGSVIFISHDLNEVIEKCDRITVFRDGSYRDTILSDGATEDQLRKLMIGRELEGEYYRNDYDGRNSDEVALSLENINVPGLLKNFNLQVHKGEIVGIGGLSDSGMHEIGKVVYSTSVEATGKVILKEKNIELKSVQQAIKEGVAYVSKNRDKEALIVNASIKDNISLNCADKFKKGPFILPKDEYEFADQYATQLQTKMQNVEQHVSALSGGNKQKVALSKWIAYGSDILVLDSPTRGIDIKVKASIYQLMRELKEQGKSIIMISEEMLELIGMSDRILIVKDGEISGEFDRSADLNEEELIKYMI